jgi:hypothetical protein
MANFRYGKSPGVHGAPATVTRMAFAAASIRNPRRNLALFGLKNGGPVWDET